MATPKRLSSRSRSLSASTWNQYADAVTRFNSPENGPRDQPDYSANLSFAKTEGDFIPPFTPCRIVSRFSLEDKDVNKVGYQVVAVDAVDSNGDDIPRNCNYAISGSQGVETDSGSVYVTGMAIVEVTKDQAVVGSLLSGYDGNAPENQYTGEAEASYYAVPDKTIFADEDIVIGPVGHFRITSWYVADSQENADSVFLCVNMDNHPTTVRVETTETLSAVGDVDGLFSFDGGNAKVWYSKDGDDYDAGTLKAEQNSNWNMRVFNLTDSEVTSGVYMATYSKEYNCFVVLVGGAGGTSAPDIVLGVNDDTFIGSGETVGVAVFERNAQNDYPTKTSEEIEVTNDWQLDFGITIPQDTKMMIAKCADGKNRPISMDAAWMLQHTMQTVYDSSIYTQDNMDNGVWQQFYWGSSGVPDVVREQGYGYSMVGSTFDISRTGRWLTTLQWDSFDHSSDDTSVRCVDWDGNVIASLTFTADSLAGTLIATEVTVTATNLSTGSVFLKWEMQRASNGSSHAEFSDVYLRLERIGD